MCRFAVYFSPRKPILLADLLTRPTHSIVKQSYNCKERKKSNFNADGFGIAWYAMNNNVMDEKACLFSSMLPAWNDENLFRISEKIDSSLIFAHVRAASRGSGVSQLNCHPFIHGKYTFMHNGGIGGFSKLKKMICDCLRYDLYETIRGTTDTEHVFKLFLNHLPADSSSNSGHFESPQTLITAFKKTVAHIIYFQKQLELKCASCMNFAVTDGRTILVSRIIVSTNAELYEKKESDIANNNYNIPVKYQMKLRRNHKKIAKAEFNVAEKRGASLYFSCGSMFAKCSDGEYRMRHINKNEDVVIVASERLTQVNEDWMEVPPNHILLINHQMNVLLMPINVERELKKFENDVRNNKWKISPKITKAV